MAQIKVLVEGYAKQINGGWLASSTVTLVDSNGRRIIIDPGCNKELLVKSLSENGWRLTDIDFVLLTHNHTDHTLLTAIFPNARVLNNEEIYYGDRQVDHRNRIPEANLEIIQTPGHDPNHCALIVPTKEGTYVVAGDVFWWKDDEQQQTEYDKLLKHPDPYVKDEQQLFESRQNILELADYVIPGHGKMFKVAK